MRDDLPDIIKEVGFDFDWENEKVWKLDIPITEIDIEKLTWHFDIPFHGHKNDVYNLTSREIIEHPEKYREEFDRTMKADLNYPIDIMENKGRWLILDGLHRLMKAYVKGQKVVNARIISRELILKLLNLSLIRANRRIVMRNNNTRKIDVIVILGGGIATDGALSSATRKRLGRLLREREKLPRVPILLSGRWSGLLKVEPHTTEAQEMKSHLVKHGIGARQIIIESESLDTISNAVFVRRIIERHRNWKKILLITSDWHMERALWIFQRILGENYKVIPLAALSNEAESVRRKAYEKYLLAVVQGFLKDVPTSSRELIRLLKTGHPFYSKSKKAQKLLKDIVSHKKEISA